MLILWIPKKTSRGRNAGYPAPHAQTRTCGFPASGSSVVLAFAQGISIMKIPDVVWWIVGVLAL